MIDLSIAYPTTDSRDNQNRLFISVEQLFYIYCIFHLSTCRTIISKPFGVRNLALGVHRLLKAEQRELKLYDQVVKEDSEFSVEADLSKVLPCMAVTFQPMTVSTGCRNSSHISGKIPDIQVSDASQKLQTPVRYSKSRLPWLDGKSLPSGSIEYKSKFKLPSIPGAFDNDQNDDGIEIKDTEVFNIDKPLERSRFSNPIGGIPNSGADIIPSVEVIPSMEASRLTPPAVIGKDDSPAQTPHELQREFKLLAANPTRAKTEHISPRGTFYKSEIREDPVADAYRQSIISMQNLLDEAVRLAQDAAEQDSSTEVPTILREAAEALKKASQTEICPLHKVSGSYPSSQLSKTTSEYSGSSEDSITSNGSSCEVEACKSKQRYHKRRSSESTCRTPPRFYKASHDSIVVDWAYANQIPKPEAAQASTRDHVNHVFRSLPTKDEVVDHIKRKGEPPILPRSSSLKPQATAIFHERPSESSMIRIRSPTSVELPFDSRPSSIYQERGYGSSPTRGTGEKHNWGRDKYEQKDYETPEALRGRHHLSLNAHQGFSLNRHHRRQPVARNWTTTRKRIAALVACLNTALIGIIVGIYAGEVPAIQYSLADEEHYVILGNVFLYIGLAVATFLFWPLPLLHGRKTYTLTALAIALPLQFPQAVVVLEQRSPYNQGYRSGLLVTRAFLGFVLGFANMNFKTTLLDLFGASLQSQHPHQEVVILDDIRRHGGGMGLWLGIWTWCFIGSIAIGFMIGAGIISQLNVAWGFYITVIIIAAVLVFGLLSPETRRAPHRRVMQHVELPNEGISRRVARGEIRMHLQGDGPKYWFEEVNAGLHLSFKMLSQLGFAVLSLYQGWIYAQIVLVIIVLGNLLSAEYHWRPEFVGLGVSSIAIGALLAIPLSKANLFSRARKQGPRTDSMTFQPRISRSSHLIRRVIFMAALPLCTLAYTLASRGPSLHFMVPIVFATTIGFLSNLAITECHGLMMETYDTSDLQPGVNSKHRLQSLASATRQRRTNFTCYPRVTAGIFISQTMGFLFAAAATGVGGRVTRHVGAQKATAIVASILMLLTILLTLVLWRFKEIQVIPNELFGRYFGSTRAMRESVGTTDSAQSWRAVVIGNPSGKMRRMSMLELGGLSRWTEIRRLNRLLTPATTKALNEGWH